MRLLFRLLEYEDAIDPNDLYPEEKIDGSLKRRLEAMSGNAPYYESNILVRIAEITSSTHALTDLAHHRNHFVRIAVADNEHAPESVKAILCEDAHPDVRFALAENSHTSSELLLRLRDDENPFVAARAAQTMKRLKATNIEQISRKFKTKIKARKFA